MTTSFPPRTSARIHQPREHTEVAQDMKGAPDFLVVGHVVQDLVSADGDWRLGGAVSYASLLARNLGLRTAALTSCAGDIPLGALLPGVQVHVVPGDSSTQFRNVYVDGVRQQWVPHRARVLTADDVPAAWRESRIVLLGPVAGEIDDSLALAFGSRSIIGIGAQGWLREIGQDTRVRPVPPADWRASAVLHRATALFLSDEDLPLDDAPAALAEWASMVDIVAFTRGYSGADVCYRGEWRRFDAYRAEPVDLTGAGDVFAAGFLVRFAETGDPWQATQFGSAAASLAIEGIGVEAVPDRNAIEERLRGG
jgi:sugar/nucleoside kinase (ribokinase family)